MTLDLLRVDDVHKSFGDTAVLRGLTLSVAQHQVVVVVGASGSGKSTLLRCVNGLEQVDAGVIVVDGIDVTADDADLDSVRRSVGMVFQSFNLFPHLSVMQNVTLAPRRVLGRTSSQAIKQARDLLARFGLADKADDYPDRLSGGQQQRVAIVRALAMEPQLMLFDEVTSALDPALVGEVLDVIRELKQSGMTILMATHEMNFAREVADTVAFVDRGRVHEIGTPDQVLGNPREQRTRDFLARVLG